MIEIRTGERLSKVIPALDALYVPIAITGAWSARVQVRPTATSSEVVYEWSTDAGSGLGTAALVTGAAGGVRITATAAETTAWLAGPSPWPSGPLAWDLRLVDSGGEPHILDLGRVQLVPHVTR